MPRARVGTGPHRHGDGQLGVFFELDDVDALCRAVGPLLEDEALRAWIARHNNAAA